MKKGWGGGRTRTVSPMKPVPLHPPRPLPLGAFLAPPSASQHRPATRPTLVPLSSRKAFLQPPTQGSRAGRLGRTGAGGAPGGEDRLRGGLSGESRTEARAGGLEWGRGRKRGGRRSWSWRAAGAWRATSGVRSPRQCWAQQEVSRPLPGPPRSPPLFPQLPPLPLRAAPPPQPPAVSAWRTWWAAGGRSCLTLPLHP